MVCNITGDSPMTPVVHPSLQSTVTQVNPSKNAWVQEMVRLWFVYIEFLYKPLESCYLICEPSIFSDIHGLHEPAQTSAAQPGTAPVTRGNGI